MTNNNTLTKEQEKRLIGEIREWAKGNYINNEYAVKELLKRLDSSVKGK